MNPPPPLGACARAHFANADGYRWNVSLIHQVFLREDVDCIRKIPLSNIHPRKNLFERHQEMMNFQRVQHIDNYKRWMVNKCLTG